MELTMKTMALPVILLLWMSVDVNYFLRVSWIIIKSTLKRRKLPGPYFTATSYGICLPVDLDFNLHMNNGRYLRECDFARVHYWNISYLYSAARKLQCRVTNRANNLRYRRSLLPFQTFTIETKLVFWDEKSFYLEQRMIRRSDKFICAVNYTCQQVIVMGPKAVTPQQILDSVYEQVKRPEAPAEIAAWIESTELSSQALFTPGTQL